MCVRCVFVRFVSDRSDAVSDGVFVCVCVWTAQVLFCFCHRKIILVFVINPLLIELFGVLV